MDKECKRGREVRENQQKIDNMREGERKSKGKVKEKERERE